MTKEKTYFLIVVDAPNHMTYYLYNSTSRKGTQPNATDCYFAIQKKTGKSLNMNKVYSEYNVYLDTAKNREEQCFGEDGSEVVDCR
jgi:hypothetical protein